MELLVSLVVIFVIYQVIKALISSARRQISPEATVRFEISGSGDYESYERPKGKPAKWYEKDSSIKIKDHEIPGGMIYAGEVLLDDSGYNNDACLINTKLKVSAAEPWEAGDEMGYWPHYGQIPARCRGAYLKWLAGGRTEPETYIGYVFLFFYGLERRLFVDGVQGTVSSEGRLSLVNEVRRLLAIYGDNRSFRGYANNFLAMEWVHFQNDKPIPDYIDFNDRYCSEPFQVILAKQVTEGRAIPPEMAIQWLILHPEYGLRTPARRCAKEFRKLFKTKYHERFNDGVIVKPNKTPLILEYRAASPSLNGRVKLSVPNISNPFLLKGPLNKINAIAEQCTEELESYSRYLGRSGNKPKSMAALSLLPKVLLKDMPGLAKAKDKLAQATAKGPILLNIRKFYDGFGEVLPSTLGKKEATTLALFVEGLGFGMAPDVRYHNIKPSPEGKVAIFSKGHGIDFRPTREYREIGTILRLGALVSQADDDVSPHEEAVLEQLIKDNRDLTGIEKDSLSAFLKWSLYCPQSATGLKQRLSELNKDEKVAVSHILISVAHADGRIDPKEIKQLEKLYTNLGLDKSQVTSDLHVLAAASAPVTVAKKEADTSYSIPPEKEAPAQGFSLNEELIRIREAETKQVKGVLERIFEDQPDDEPEQVEPEALPVMNTTLDRQHMDLLNQLIIRETWKKQTIHELCQGLGLMVDGAMEVINEWAFENVNAPLIEDGDTVYVDIDLAKEMLSA